MLLLDAQQFKGKFEEARTTNASLRTQPNTPLKEGKAEKKEQAEKEKEVEAVAEELAKVDVNKDKKEEEETKAE